MKQCPICGLISPYAAERCDCGFDFPSRSFKASYDKNYTPLASLSDRVAGQVLDSLIAFAPLGLALGLAQVSTRLGVIGKVLCLVILIGAILWLLWYLLFADALKGGQSYGKRAARAAVIDASTGAYCTIWQSVVRNLSLIILGFFDWIFVLGDRRQRLGDKAANTIVIKVAPQAGKRCA